MEEEVLEILKSVLELDSVDGTCSQETCEKWDSMAQLNIIVELESEFGVSFEPEQISEMKSVTEILNILSKMRA